MRQQAFTVIEIIIVAVFLITAGVVAFFQYERLLEQQADDQKKTAINAIYYSLEEGYFPTHQSYPEHIDKDTLPTMDSSLLTDPYDITLGEQDSAYRYEPKNCKDGQCRSYTLRTSLSHESDFVKQSQHN